MLNDRTANDGRFRHRLPGEELEAAISIAMAVLIGAGATEHGLSRRRLLTRRSLDSAELVGWPRD
jgi:hypothetical protein